MSGSINAALIICKICVLIINLRIGFSGVLSSCSGESVTKPWNTYERFFQYLRPMSSRLGSLNHARTSFKISHVSPYISIHGICTCTGRESVSPFTPANGSLIIKRSFQKKVFDSSPSGKKRRVLVSPSFIFQNGKIALSPPLVEPPLVRDSCSFSFALISANDAIVLPPYILPIALCLKIIYHIMYYTIIFSRSQPFSASFLN